MSALAPIVAPSLVPWGQKAFAGYLEAPVAEFEAALARGPMDSHDTGLIPASWLAHDATYLVREHVRAGELLIDQGQSDKFLARELQPERFEHACAEAGQRLNLRRHDGYDHSYYFIATFMADHLEHHARWLR